MTVFGSTFIKPARVILSPLPRLFVYVHCPFCVRTRLAFGLKNIKHEAYFLANDDVDTPTALIGKKMAPIFQLRDENLAMGESLDIIKKVDTDPKYGPINLFKPLSDRTDIKLWQDKVSNTMRILQRPRYVKSFLPEFLQQDGRDAFVKNHPIPPYEKADWKALALSDQWSKYEAAFEESKGLVDEVNKYLLELEPLVYNDEFATEGGLSIDDIDLWSRLSSITLIKGVQWPAKLRSYMDFFSKQGDVPLYDSLAL